MHIAVDDTYGPKNFGKSKYVTGERRTSVGVVFKDDEVEYVRNQIRECLIEIGKSLPWLPENSIL